VSVFSFRLEPLLSLRRHEEKVKQQSLAVVSAARDTRRQHLQATRRQFQDARSQLGALEKGTLPLTRIRNGYLYLEGLRRRMARSTVEIEKLGEVIVGRRRELVEAARHRRSLEKLRERYRQRFLEAEMRNETKVLDEIGTNQAVRNANKERD